jgi:hypothetical protein
MHVRDPFSVVACFPMARIRLPHMRTGIHGSAPARLQVDRYTAEEVHVRPEWQEAALVLPPGMTYCDSTMLYVAAVSPKLPAFVSSALLRVSLSVG